MTNRAADEAIEAIRSAVRALRAAEKALKLAQTERQEPVDTALPQAPQEPAREIQERMLLDFIASEARKAKEFEEQDPDSFRTIVTDKIEDLKQSVVKGDMYQVGPESAGMVSFDNTDATTAYEMCLKAMRSHELHASDIMSPFVEDASIKNWGDVDTSNDLVIMRYETPGPLDVDLSERVLTTLVERARKIAGAVDRVRSTLAEQGIHWEVSDPRTGVLDCSIRVDGVSGKWAACIPVDRVLTDIVGKLGVVEVDYDSQQEGWWDAARIDRSIPQKMLPIIRSKEPRIICHKEDLAPLEEWASNLPGWYDFTSTPLVMRDAVSNDILQ